MDHESASRLHTMLQFEGQEASGSISKKIAFNFENGKAGID